MSHYQYSHLDDTSIQPPPQSWYKSPTILAASAVGVGIFTYSIITGFHTPEVTHYLLDDYSKSAAQNAPQRQEHCQGSNQNYQAGDSVVQIHFANRPEVVKRRNITNILNSESCEGMETTDADFGDVPGTSPIAALDYVKDLIEASRTKGDRNPVVVTMTLQAAEPVPGQPLLDEEGFAQLKNLVQDISSERGVISIIGPKGKLQRQLQSYLKTEPSVKICSFNDVTECVDWAFQKGRSLGKVKSHAFKSQK
ncbi:MAG: hypothetical protein AB4426_16440 [Xenococcaceae cyanobacterium]